MRTATNQALNKKQPTNRPRDRLDGLVAIPSPINQADMWFRWSMTRQGWETIFAHGLARARPQQSEFRHTRRRKQEQRPSSFCAVEASSPVECGLEWLPANSIANSAVPPQQLFCQDPFKGDQQRHVKQVCS
jgi:hypothetical protein